MICNDVTAFSLDVLMFAMHTAAHAPHTPKLVHMTNVKVRKPHLDESGIPRYPGFNYGRHNRF